MILEDIKTMLEIEDTLQDNLISIYIRKAKILITNYLNLGDIVDFETLYPDAIIEYSIICMNKRGNEGIKSFAQGAISATYGDDLQISVKNLLPLPCIRMR